MEISGAVQSQEMREGSPVFNIFRSSEPRPHKASSDKEKAPIAAVQADPSRGDNTEQKIERVIKAIDDFFKSTQRDLQFSVDTETGTTVVKVISTADGKVIREIPPEEMLSLAAKMEELIGALFNEKV